MLLVYALFTALTPDTFARAQNLVTMTRQTVVVAIASVGMTLIIVHGGIDLSVGSAVALTTIVVAKMLQSGAGPWASAFVGIAVASLTGLVNGLLITRLRLAPFIVTLGSMSILRGAAKGLAKEQKIDADPKGLDALLTPSHGIFALFPAGVLIALAIALLAAFVLTYTRFGRHVYAVGSNERTARLAGIDVSRVRLIVYTAAAALVGVAGVMEFSTLTVGDPTDSVGLELDAIAAVVIGGASLEGGEGSISGSLVGAFLMTILKTGCQHMGLSNWVQEIVTGAIIIIAVAFDRVRRARR
jgi:ribose transport system permease protein